MRSRVEDIRHQLIQLSKPELAEIVTYARALVRNDVASETPSAGKDIDWMYPVFEIECKRLGLGFITKATKGLVLRHREAVEAFLEQACPGANLAVKRIVFGTGVDLLYRDMIGNGRITNPRNLAFGLDRLSAVLDKSFPGYADCGALAKIIKPPGGRR
jgi:hypothetical protein